MPVKKESASSPRGRAAEETPTRRRGAVEETETTTSREVSSPKESGWAAVAKRQKEAAARKAAAEDSKSAIRDFWLKSGESAVVQILNEEPYVYDGHNIKDGDGKWGFSPCQLASQKYCLMCREKIKSGWKAGFKVLDYRGTWDKESSSFKWDEPIEKLWSVNQTILGQLQTIKTKRGKPLTDLVLEVMRTGTGKTDTSYNFEQAFDEDDKKLVAVDWDDEYPKLSILLAPMTDEQLVEKGFEAPDEK